jgi:hypothetical protein
VSLENVERYRGAEGQRAKRKRGKKAETLRMDI